MTPGASRLLCAALLVAASAAPARAAIYRWIDEEGVVNYTDERWRFDQFRRRTAPYDADVAVERRPEIRPAEPAPPAPALLPPAPAPGEEASPGAMHGAAEEVMRLSGLDAQVDGFSANVQAQFEMWRWRRPDLGAARLAVAQAFSPDLLRRHMQWSLSQRLDAERTASLLTWLRTPLSRRIVERENPPPSRERTARQAAFLNGLPSSPPSPARVALLHRLDRAGDVTELSAVVLGAAGAALNQTVAPFLSPGALPRTAMSAEANRPPMDEMFRFRVMTALAFAYHGLSDDELGRYATFLESATGRWFTQVSRAALLGSLEQVSRRMASPPRAAAPGRPGPR
jgi:uncharacterized protein DUF4124